MTTPTATRTTPSREELHRLAAAGEGNLAAIYREVRADLETPVSAYLKVARGDYSFLLESVEGGERMGRYSFIGTEPYRVSALHHEDGDPLSVIEDEIASSARSRRPACRASTAAPSATSATRRSATSSACRSRRRTRSACPSPG